MSVSQIAKSLGVAWHTVNDAVLEEARTALFSDPARLEGVRVVGVDEHVWTHKRRSKFVTVIIDLTPVRDQRGPARLLDVVEGRTKAALQQWLHERPQGWRDGVEFVAMDGFTGYKTAAAEELPNAVAVMDPFHVVHLAADGLEKTRQRVQQDVYGHRGRAGEPLYGHRRIMLTGWPLLGDRQQDRLNELFTKEEFTEVWATWEFYQDIIAAYRDPNRTRGRAKMEEVIKAIGSGIPKELVELAKLGRTLKRRAEDILAYFGNPHTSNGPTEAINGRLEHLRGIAYGFRNLANYIARCLLESGGFKTALHP